MRLGGALFGNAMNTKVENLDFEGITVESQSTDVTHVGVLVNTLKGYSKFTNVTVSNSSVSTANGAAGGIVGYVVRENETDRNETLAVTFDNCHVAGVNVDGTISEGHFVGLLSGYDNGEVLTFNDNCSYSISSDEPATYSARINNAATKADSGFVSPYSEGNEATWLADNNYSKYNGWLGNEKYYRGIVNYGSNRFVPKWDGITKVTPLNEDGNKAIYSAFDLASQQNISAGSLKFMESVDMANTVFVPLTYISNLYGNDKTIYNLKVDTQFDANAFSGGAFARRCAGGTLEDITFNNANVKVTHNSGDGDAYAAIVCATLEGNKVYMNNIKVIGGSLYGVNKMGGIAGYIPADLEATNCVVDELSIENYDSGGKDSFGFKANGEIGGMFGFIASNTTIYGCYVRNTKLDCIGVDNGRALKIFKYAGRHVNEFIGDIRTTNGQNIVITYNDTDFSGNEYRDVNGNGKGGRKDQYSKCNKIGHCYYTSINAIIAKIEDKKGTVTVNGNSITVAKNY